MPKTFAKTLFVNDENVVRQNAPLTVPAKSGTAFAVSAE